MPAKLALIGGKTLELDNSGALTMEGKRVTATLDNAAVDLAASNAEINAAADVSARLIEIADAATYTVLVANSGKTHVLPDLSQDIVITLPAVASGLEYVFIYGGVAADTSDWQIDTGSDTNFYLGGLMHADLDGDLNVAIAGDGNSNSLLNILVPEAGTRVHVICDGTSWILSGLVSGDTLPTFADQS